MSSLVRTDAPTVSSPPLVEAIGLGRRFRLRSGFFSPRREFDAVKSVDLVIGRGETVGVVGESGCGKSTLGRMLLWLLEPTAGTVRFDGIDLASLAAADLRRFRRRMQLVFQDPYASLDPRREIWRQIADPIVVHDLSPASDVRPRAEALLGKIGLSPAMADRYPHAFSGGQRQRIAIARALAAEPDFLVADEPVSALDVSVQAQLLNLLSELGAERHLAMLFVSHDLAVVRHVARRVLVMYFGRIVEQGPAAAVLGHPRHPYTQALVAVSPSLKRPRSSAPRATLAGELPSPLSPPTGCVFRTRCPQARAACGDAEPPLREMASGHQAACHRLDEI